MVDNVLRRACKDIIHCLLMNGSDDLEKLKIQVCRKYQLKKLPTNSEILSLASKDEREKLLPTLRLKPVRSVSGINVIAVMSKPYPCPHGKCAYCPSIEGIPNSYTGREPSTMRGVQNEFNPYKQVRNRLLQLKKIGHSVSKTELIIQGGTFPATPIAYRQAFIKECLDALTFKQSNNLEEAKLHAVNSVLKNVGIAVETRPDYARERHVDTMLEMGVTKVELGVQNIYDDIYRLVERGHDVSDVIQATRVLKDSGLKICYHMMPGLPTSDHRRDLNAFRTLFQNQAFQPDMLKIYPCLVIKGTKIYDWWKTDQYKPYTTEEAVDLLVEIKRFLPPWVRIMRVQRDIPSQLIIAGVKKSNLRQIVLEKLRAEGEICRCIRCREIGHRTQLHKIEPVLSNIDLIIRRYAASEGVEYFLAFEDPKNDALIGYLRLRIPSPKAHRPEILSQKSSIVRELHVFGPLVPIGKRLPKTWQHQGFGAALLKEAERLSVEEFDRPHIVVTSALGARNYFHHFGYHLKGPYMSKTLTTD